MYPAEGRAIGGGLLVHVLVADIDFGGVGVDAFQTHAEALAFATVEDLINDGAQNRADPAFGNLGAVFGPVGFDEACARILGTNRETLLVPELKQLWVDLLDRPGHHQPAQIAISLDLDIVFARPRLRLADSRLLGVCRGVLRESGHAIGRPPAASPVG